VRRRIQADLKTIGSARLLRYEAITAITVQNTLGVSAIHRLPPEILGDRSMRCWATWREAVKYRHAAHDPRSCTSWGKRSTAPVVRQVVLDR